ncbi:MAG: ankyrin repeat domain-containing protein [Micavibrio sp.]|nr:ankyrin repeat domain-containing protein [Micavibrio sp.]
MMLDGINKKDPEIIRGCLLQGGNPDVPVKETEKGPLRPLLHWAMRNFNEAAAKELLDASSSVDVRDPAGNTALFYAIEMRDKAAVEFLMKNGADPVAQNNAGVVAMDVARNIDGYYAAARDLVIKALTHDYGIAARRQEGVQDDTPSNNAVPQKGIKILHPVNFDPPPHKDGTAFKL